MRVAVGVRECVCMEWGGEKKFWHSFQSWVASQVVITVVLTHSA